MDTLIKRSVNWQEVVVTIITCLILLATLYANYLADFEAEKLEYILYVTGMVIFALMLWSVVIAKQVGKGAYCLSVWWGTVNAVATLAFIVLAYWWNDGFFTVWLNIGYTVIFIVLLVIGGIIGDDSKLSDELNG